MSYNVPVDISIPEVQSGIILEQNYFNNDSICFNYPAYIRVSNINPVRFREYLPNVLVYEIV